MLTLLRVVGKGNAPYHLHSKVPCKSCRFPQRLLGCSLL
jgi:hypothetical protein